MHTPPQLLPTQLEDGTAPGVRYRIQGELVPVLHAWLDGSVPIFFEHHVVLYKDPQLDIGMRAMKGAFKRVVAGMSIFMTEARGRSRSHEMGRDTFSRSIYSKDRAW